MQINSKRNRVTIWIACLAILLNALVPSISHALSSSGKQYGSDLTFWEICRADASATPIRAPNANGYAKASKSSSQPSRSGTYAMEDCAYCLTQAGSTGIMSAIGAIPTLPDGHEIRSIPVVQVPQPILTLYFPPSRGPPAAIYL